MNMEIKSPRKGVMFQLHYLPLFCILMQVTNHLKCQHSDLMFQEDYLHSVAEEPVLATPEDRMLPEQEKKDAEPKQQRENARPRPLKRSPKTRLTAQKRLERILTNECCRNRPTFAAVISLISFHSLTHFHQSCQQTVVLKE